MKQQQYGFRTSSLHDWTYYKIPYEEEGVNFMRDQISAPSFMRLCNILKEGTKNGIYVTQPGESLRRPWQKYDHPLDVLQNSLDLAAAKDIYTQEQFKRIPKPLEDSIHNFYGNDDEDKNEITNVNDNSCSNGKNIRKINDKYVCTIPGVEDIFLSRQFCRQYSCICDKLLITKVLKPLKTLCRHREIEYCRKACRRMWVFVLYKRRQEREHKRISQIMNKLERQGHYRFRGRVRSMLVEWKAVARKEQLHLFWQYKIFRLTWLWKRWLEHLNRQKWNNCGAGM